MTSKPAARIYIVENARQRVSSWLDRHAAVFTGCTIAVFLLLNAWKVSLFNLFITDPAGAYGAAATTAVYFTSLTLATFMFAITLRFKKSYVFAAAYLAQTLFILSNLVYFCFFQSYIQVSQYFELWSETLELMKRSAVPFDHKTLIIFMDLPAAFILAVCYRCIARFNRRPILRYLVYAPCLVMIAGIARWDPLSDGSPLQLLNDRYASETEAVKKYGLLTYNLVNLLNIRNNSRLIGQLDRGKPMVSAGDSTASRPSFFIIQVESMDAFVVQHKYKGAFVTPFLRELSRKCVHYPYALSYHLAGSTSDCEFSVINTTEPLDKFPSIKVRNYEFPNSFIKRMTAAGYDVSLFHGNEGTYFNRTIALRKMGVPWFFDMKAMDLRHVGWGAPDHEVFSFVKSYLRDAPQPFLAYVITMSTHEPFIFTRHYYTNSRYDAIPDKRVRDYFTSMSYLDRTLKNVVYEIYRDYPDTYVLIFGDHAPGIRSKYYRQSLLKAGDVRFEYVPLFIITPDRRVHYERNRCASFLDVAPTVLASAGIPFEIKTFGENLLGDSLSASVPLRGRSHDRARLFKQIRDVRR